MSPKLQPTKSWLQCLSDQSPESRSTSLEIGRGRRMSYWGRSLLLVTFSLLGWLAFSTAASARLARIYSIEEGQVKLKREGWSQYHPAFPGTLLYADDLLDVEPGAEVVLICPDREQTDAVRAGISNVSSACPDAPRRVRPVFGVSDTWSAGDPSIPYVITPWSDQVLTATPELRWNSVPAAERYTVTLRQRSGSRWSEVWSVVTDQTTLCYPADQPQLEPGEEYAVQITTGSGSTSAVEWTPPVVFSLMGSDERVAAEAAIDAVNGMEVSRELKTLILVEEVYPNHRLFAQGIRDLLDLIAAGTETVRVYRLLGDYFIRSGLELPTETHYLKALELAEAAEHLEEQVKAQWGLGTLYNRVGKTEQAREYLTAAQEGATALGDEDLLARINAELGD